MSANLAGKVCVVTGASRGIGKGIALQLGHAGATVYITGRTLKAKDGTPGSLMTTADEITARGGTCIPVQCDHSIASDVEKLFERVKHEQNGQLDVLVNNAYAGAEIMFANTGKKFYESDPVEMWDTLNNCGLRNHYICSVYASRMMIANKTGLIVNISSAGGLHYKFNAAYGVGKEACDRMAADCGHELRSSNVAFVSLWPGAVKTEKIGLFLEATKDNPEMDQTRALFVNGETAEFSGLCIAHLATDPNIMKKTGKILLTAELGEEYGIKDVDGKTHGLPRYYSAFVKKCRLE